MSKSRLPGKLELIVGPMRSNKTAELLRRIEIRRQYAKQWVLLLKPSADTKAAQGLVESRNQNGCGKMEAVGGSVERAADAGGDRTAHWQARGVSCDRRRPVCRGLVSVYETAVGDGPRCDGVGAGTGFSRSSIRGDAGSVVAGADLCRQYHGVGGLLQLRGEGAVSAAAGGWDTGSLWESDHHGRRFL